MAEKRSNKTARVLNLITQQKGEEPKEKVEEHSEAKVAPAETAAAKREVEVQSDPDAAQQTERKPTRRRTAKAPARPRTTAAKKKIIEEELLLDEDEEMEEIDEIEEEVPVAAAPVAPAAPVAHPAHPAHPAPTAPPPVVVPIVQNAKDHELALSDEIRSGLLSVLEEEEKTTAPEEEAEEEAKAAEDKAERQKKIHFIEKEDRAEEMVATPHGEQHVRYINVMQELVEESEPDYLPMLHCHCPRCIADVKALALTNLPSKYVVIDQDKKNIMMSFYASRYESILPVQIMRACLIVNENPHH